MAKLTRQGVRDLNDRGWRSDYETASKDKLQASFEAKSSHAWDMRWDMRHQTLPEKAAWDEVRTVQDLIYDPRGQSEIRKHFPWAHFYSEWNMFSGYRIFVTVPNTTTRQWIRVMIETGLATVSFMTQVMLKCEDEIGLIVQEMDKIRPGWRT